MTTDRPRGQRSPRPPGWTAEAGNTLVLFPVAVLIVLGLGGLALDSATVFLGQRRLADLAAGIANDAASAVDRDTIFGGATGQVELDAERGAVRQAQLVSSQAQDRGFEAIECDVAVASDPARAIVTCRAQVRPLFAPVVPGMDRVKTVRATETAVARIG